MYINIKIYTSPCRALLQHYQEQTRKYYTHKFVTYKKDLAAWFILHEQQKGIRAVAEGLLAITDKLPRYRQKNCTFENRPVKETNRSLAVIRAALSTKAQSLRAADIKRLLFLLFWPTPWGLLKAFVRLTLSSQGVGICSCFFCGQHLGGMQKKSICPDL